MELVVVLVARLDLLAAGVVGIAIQFGRDLVPRRRNKGKEKCFSSGDILRIEWTSKYVVHGTTIRSMERLLKNSLGRLNSQERWPLPNQLVKKQSKFRPPCLAVNKQQPHHR